MPAGGVKLRADEDGIGDTGLRAAGTGGFALLGAGAGDAAAAGWVYVFTEAAGASPYSPSFCDPSK